MRTETRTWKVNAFVNVSTDGRFFAELQYPGGFSLALIALDGGDLEYLDLGRGCRLKTGMFREFVHRELGLYVTGDMIWDWFGNLTARSRRTSRCFQVGGNDVLCVTWFPGQDRSNGALVIELPGHRARFKLSITQRLDSDVDQCRWTFSRTGVPVCETMTGF